jgi:hypothetical protein
VFVQSHHEGTTESQDEKLVRLNKTPDFQISRRGRKQRDPMMECNAHDTYIASLLADPNIPGSVRK